MGQRQHRRERQGFLVLNQRLAAPKHSRDSSSTARKGRAFLLCNSALSSRKHSRAAPATEKMMRPLSDAVVLPACYPHQRDDAPTVQCDLHHLFGWCGAAGVVEGAGGGPAARRHEQPGRRRGLGRGRHRGGPKGAAAAPQWKGGAFLR